MKPSSRLLICSCLIIATQVSVSADFLPSGTVDNSLETEQGATLSGLVAQQCLGFARALVHESIIDAQSDLDASVNDLMKASTSLLKEVAAGSAHSHSVSMAAGSAVKANEKTKALIEACISNSIAEQEHK